MAEVSLAGALRDSTGSSSSRRLRTAGRIPATVYGHGTKPLSIDVDGRELRGALTTEAALNALISLKVGDKKHLVLARELQRHPAKGTVSHVDFQIVRRDEMVTAEVPLQFVGEASKVTKAGGVVEFVLDTLTVIATPTSLPSSLEVDLSALIPDEPIRVRDVTLPKGVMTSLDPDEPIVTGTVASDVESAADAPAEGEVASEAATSES